MSFAPPCCIHKHMFKEPVPKNCIRANSGSSFYWAMKLMPANKRAAMFAIYGFCRDVDDIADGDAPAPEKMARLEEHRQAVEALYAGDTPDIACVQCLKGVVDTFAIKKANLLAVVDGMEMDAFDTVIMPDEATFDLYIDRVASAVGRLSNAVFGISGPDAERLAHHLGRALQITNILRDLDEDAGLGRLYLPHDLLGAHGIEADTPDAVLKHPNLEAVLRVLAARAHWHYEQSTDALTRLNPADTKAARLMQVVYGRILERLEERGLARIDEPITLSKFEKLGLVLRHGIFA